MTYYWEGKNCMNVVEKLSAIGWRKEVVACRRCYFCKYKNAIFLSGL